MTKKEIINYLKKNKEEFEKKYNIEKIALFGSFARNEASEDSDIDLIYSLKDGCKMTFDKYLTFENNLKKSLNSKVDLINEKKLNPLIKMNALKDFIYV